MDSVAVCDDEWHVVVTECQDRVADANAWDTVPEYTFLCDQEKTGAQQTAEGSKTAVDSANKEQVDRVVHELERILLHATTLEEAKKSTISIHDTTRLPQPNRRPYNRATSRPHL